MLPSLQQVESHAWLVRTKENQLHGEEVFLSSTGMPAGRGRHGCRERGAHGLLSLGAHHTLSWLEVLISLCLCSEGSFLPTTSLPKAGTLLLSWPVLPTLGSAFKWPIPEGFQGKPPKGRAVQHPQPAGPREGYACSSCPSSRVLKAPQISSRLERAQSAC